MIAPFRAVEGVGAGHFGQSRCQNVCDLHPRMIFWQDQQKARGEPEGKSTPRARHFCYSIMGALRAEQCGELRSAAGKLKHTLLRQCALHELHQIRVVLGR
jgi:hypothetical protein